VADPKPPDSSPDATPLAPVPGAGRAARRPIVRALVGGVLSGVRQAGRHLQSVALGRRIEGPVTPSETPAPAPEAPPFEATNRRVSVLHAVTEQLRGAADDYIAAKMDEIEARVDQKLDHIEGRIDRKIVELHEQLAEMRDRELRHRLRLLKITLVFTVLVALLSLGYKWVEKIWQLK